MKGKRRNLRVWMGRLAVCIWGVGTVLLLLVSMTELFPVTVDEKMWRAAAAKGSAAAVNEYLRQCVKCLHLRGAQTTLEGAERAMGRVSRLQLDVASRGGEQKREQVRGAAFRPDGERLLTTGSAQFSEWETATGKLVMGNALTELGDYADAAAYWAGGEKAAAAGSNGKLVAWNTKTGEALGEQETGQRIEELAGRGNRIGWVNGGKAWIWEAGRSEPVVVEHADAEGIGFTAAGGAVTAGRGRVRIWDAGGRMRSEREFETFGLYAGMSEDGGAVYFVSREKLEAFAAESGKKLGEFTAAGEELRVACGVGGKIAAGTVSGTAAQWDLATGRREKFLAAHPRGVEKIACSEDGRYFATVGDAGREVKIWGFAAGSGSGKVTVVETGDEEEGALGLARWAADWNLDEWAPAVTDSFVGNVSGTNMVVFLNAALFGGWVAWVRRRR